MRKNTVLIIGGGIEQEGAYRQARSSGFHIVGSDVDPFAPSLRLADETIVCSSRDPAGILRALKKKGLHEQIVGVLTIANDVPITVSFLSSALGTTGLPEKSAKLLGNKVAMKKRFVEKGIATPDFSEVWDLGTLHKKISNGLHGRRWVVKPANGRGARGVLQVDADSDLQGRFKVASAIGRPLLLEEYVDGEQYSTESFVLNGIAHTVGISVRNYSRIREFYPHIIEDGGDIRRDYSRGLKAYIDSFVQRIAEALGVRGGPLKCDLILDSKGSLHVIEAAGRLSGGWFASDQIPAATGVSLVRANLIWATGGELSPSDLVASKSVAVSTRFLFCAEGKISKLSGVSDALGVPGILKAGFYKKIGDYQGPITSHADRLGYVIGAGESTDQALMRIKVAMSKLDVDIFQSKEDFRASR